VETDHRIEVFEIDLAEGMQIYFLVKLLALLVAS
jgi:hypothetical protein